MSDVTRILNAIERGEAKATDELLPLVYEELRLLAAEAMRRILVDDARRKQSLKGSGGRRRVDMDEVSLPAQALFDVSLSEDLLALDEALEKLNKAED